MDTERTALSQDFEFFQFYLAITNRCNLKCIMCSTTLHPHELENELTLDEWLKVLENITRFKVEVITFGGGEPFLRENDLRQMITFVASKGITVNVVTNGTLINEQFLQSISGFKKRVIFLISCDGLEQENDLIRGKGVFAKIIRAVNMIREQGFTLYITSVIMPENFCNFIDFLNFFHDRYPDVSIDIQPVIPHNEIYYRRCNFELTNEQIEQLEGVVDFLHAANNTIKLCRPLKIIDRYPDYFKGTLKTQNQCKMGTDSFNVNLRGNIWICGKELNCPLHKYKLEEVFQTEEYIKEMKRVQACQSPCLAGLVI